VSAVDPNLVPVIVIPSGGGGVTLPTTAADDVIDGATPDSFFTTDAAGNGELITAASARTLLGVPTFPATDPSDIIDGAAASRFFTTDALGTGALVTVATAQTTLGIETDPGLPSSGLVARWLASALSLSDGDAVATWAPSTGSPGSLTASGTDRPTYRATGNCVGGPAVEFNGTTNKMTLSSPSGLPTVNAAGSMVAILSRTKTNAGNYAHVVQYGAASARQARGLATRSAIWRSHEWSSSVNPTVAEPPVRQAAQVAGWVYDGTDVTIWADGVPVVQGTYNPSGGLNTVATTLAVGANVNNTELCSMRLVCLAFYDTALTDAQWAQIMKHARLAYGVL
jgi:hypothetical protein